MPGHNRQLPIEQVKVIWFERFSHSHLVDDRTFDSFSYGDASATLVTPQKLETEIAGWNEDGSLDPLLAELETVPEGVLVGFNC